MSGSRITAASQRGGRRAGGRPTGPAGRGQQSPLPRPGRPARRVNQTARAIAAMTTTTRATCHASELSSPASTRRPALRRPPQPTTLPAPSAYVRNSRQAGTERRAPSGGALPFLGTAPAPCGLAYGPGRPPRGGRCPCARAGGKGGASAPVARPASTLNGAPAEGAGAGHGRAEPGLGPGSDTECGPGSYIRQLTDVLLCNLHETCLCKRHDLARDR